MNKTPSRSDVIGQKLIGIGHSAYTAPQFILEGIGPASFRTHYLTLGNGLILALCTVDIALASESDIAMPGETVGIPTSTLIGRPVTSLLRDDAYSSLIILEEDIFLRDDNDSVYGNPLLAGRLSEHYTAEALARFIDYWTEHPVSLRR